MEGITDSALIVEKFKETYSSMTGIVVIAAAIITIAFLAVFFAIRKEKMTEKVNAVKVSPKYTLLAAAAGFLMYFSIVGILINLPLSEGMLESYSSMASGCFSFSCHSINCSKFRHTSSRLVIRLSSLWK